MMRRNFVIEVSRRLGLNESLIEKDFFLHQILLDLMKMSFAEEFAFKGGSCLIKCYLGYYRFSIDLDFTFINQLLFEGLSQKNIRKYLSEKIDSIGKVLLKISEQRGFDFKPEKGNKRYIELGGGNKFATFKLWFPSISGTEAFIKIQMNFVEKIIFQVKKAKLKTICPESKELKFLFPSQYQEYRTSISLNVYDIREILCEKVRAILTRKGFKDRDFIDIFFITKKFRIHAWELEEEILEKLRFALKLYQKYRENIRAKSSILDVNIISNVSERHLLIEKINEKEYYSFLREIIPWLKEIAKKFI